MGTEKEIRMNADIAFANKQYNEALNLYQKVLETSPDDVYILSRAGSICVPLGKFEDALKYFGHAREVEPKNGDVAFNYGNACFFGNDYTGAFNAYVEAEQLGCEEDTLARLYYQMALLCGARQDFKSALIYFKKCEDADHSGVISLNPELISEKLKIYMVEKDYKNAGTCAAQMVAIQPALFRNYMVYYSILMADKKYTAAEKVLSDAENYADKTEEDEFTLALQFASLCVARGEADPEKRPEYIDKAIRLLQDQIPKCQANPKHRVDAMLSLSEIYLKAEMYAESIEMLRCILKGAPAPKRADAGEAADAYGYLSDEEIEAMLAADMELIQDSIDAGLLSEDISEIAEIGYDEEGNEIPVYDDSVFDVLGNNEIPADEAEDGSEEQEIPYDLPTDTREKVYFNLLSADLALDDYASAEKAAKVLKLSNNKYYKYYGVYTCAMLAGKLQKDKNHVAKLYTEAIAFFRSRSFENHNDALAVIFRARLYAEQGKYQKAAELAQLMNETDRASLLNYIETCKS